MSGLDTATGASGDLRRSLTLWHAVLYGLGVTIGAGIYVLIAPAAGRAGMSAPLAFIVAAAMMGLTAASFAELGSRMPVAAGEAAYARAGFRSERIGDVVGFLAIALAVLTSATISIGAAGYIRVFVDLPIPMLVTLVVLSMGAVAAYGIVELVTMAGVMTLIELGGLIVVACIGLATLPGAIARLPEMIPNGLPAWQGLFGAGLLAVFAFIGYEGIVNVAEELERPRLNLPRAIFITLALTTLLYVVVMWVALLAAGPERLAASNAPLALVFTVLTGLSPRTMSAVAIVATLNGIIVNIIMASRVLYGLSRSGRLPPLLGHVNPRTQTPLFATALTILAVLGFALLFRLEWLADLSSRVTLIVFTIINIALARIKARESEPPPGIFIAPAWVPWAGAMSSIAFIAADFVL